MIIADAVTSGTARRAAIGSVLFAAGLLAAPARAEFDFSPPGRMVSVAGTTLHLDCVGDGTPTVVVDTGLGEPAVEWLPVQGRVRHHARICLYDRAGYGWSDVGAAPRTSSRIVNELYALLTRAGERGPFVLVGHSFGGMNVQLFARRYPYLVAGAVLVDASNPALVGRLHLPYMDSVNDTRGKSMGGMPSHQLMAAPMIPAGIDEDSPQMLGLLQMSRPAAMRTVANEYKNFKLSATLTLGNAGRFPAVPLVVLSRGRNETAGDGWALRNEAAWRSLQDDLARLSPRAAHIVALNSGHAIHVQQPDLVADAITMVVDFARADAHTGPRDPGGATSVLRFDDAQWVADTLHTAADICPFGCSDGLFAPEVARAGHLAGTGTPAWQRIRYHRDDAGIVAGAAP